MGCNDMGEVDGGKARTWGAGGRQISEPTELYHGIISQRDKKIFSYIWRKLIPIFLFCPLFSLLPLMINHFKLLLSFFPLFVINFIYDICKTSFWIFIYTVRMQSYRESERQKEGSSICGFNPTTTPNGYNSFGMGRSHEPGMPYWSPTWVAGL